MAEKTKPSRRFKVLLACSLALNLLVVGLIAGTAWRHSGGKGGEWRKAPPGMQGYAAPYVRALPKEDRRALRKAVRQSGQAGSRAARIASYQDMLGALRAEPFEPATVRALLDAQRDRVLGLQAAGQDRWLSLIEGMSAEDRAAYADQLEETLKRPRKGGGEGKHSGKHDGKNGGKPKQD